MEMALVPFVFIVIYAPFILAVVCLVVVQIAIGISVQKNAHQLPSLAMDFGPWIWSLLAFSVPGLGVLCYWLMNHSTLSRKPDLQ